MAEYDVWVSGPLGTEPYTKQPFPSKEAARRWVRRYIPDADVLILERSEKGVMPLDASAR